MNQQSYNQSSQQPSHQYSPNTVHQSSSNPNNFNPSSQQPPQSQNALTLDDFFQDQSSSTTSTLFIPYQQFPQQQYQHHHQQNQQHQSPSNQPTNFSLNSHQFLDQHSSSDDTSTDNDDDTDDDTFDSSTQLLPKEIRRTDESITQAFQRFRKSQATEDEFIKKLDQEQYLETHEQIALIQEMSSQAQLMATIWRYLSLICTILWATVITIFYLLVITNSTTVSFYNEMLHHLSPIQFFFIQFPLLLSSYTHIVFAHQIPRFSDNVLILTTAATFVSTTLYIIALLLHNLLSFHELLIPGLNIINFLIVGYAYYSIRQSHQLIVDLKQSKYRYQSI